MGLIIPMVYRGYGMGWEGRVLPGIGVYYNISTEYLDTHVVYWYCERDSNYPRGFGLGVLLCLGESDLHAAIRLSSFFKGIQNKSLVPTSGF